MYYYIFRLFPIHLDYVILPNRKLILITQHCQVVHIYYENQTQIYDAMWCNTIFQSTLASYANTWRTALNSIHICLGKLWHSLLNDARYYASKPKFVRVFRNVWAKNNHQQHHWSTSIRYISIECWFNTCCGSYLHP